MLLKSRGNWSIDWIYFSMISTIRSHRKFAAIPKLPFNFGTDDILPCLKLNVSRAYLILRCRLRANVLHFVSIFLNNDDSSLRILIIWILQAHFSFVYLVYRNYILSWRFYVHWKIAWFMLIRLSPYWIMHKSWI